MHVSSKYFKSFVYRIANMAKCMTKLSRIHNKQYFVSIKKKLLKNSVIFIILKTYFWLQNINIDMQIYNTQLLF